LDDWQHWQHISVYLSTGSSLEDLSSTEKVRSYKLWTDRASGLAAGPSRAPRPGSARLGPARAVPIQNVALCYISNRRLENALSAILFDSMWLVNHWKEYKFSCPSLVRVKILFEQKQWDVQLWPLSKSGTSDLSASQIFRDYFLLSFEVGWIVLVLFVLGSDIFFSTRHLTILYFLKT